MATMVELGRAQGSPWQDIALQLLGTYSSVRHLVEAQDRARQAMVGHGSDGTTGSSGRIDLWQLMAAHGTDDERTRAKDYIDAWHRG